MAATPRMVGTVFSAAADEPTKRNHPAISTSSAVPP